MFSVRVVSQLCTQEVGTESLCLPVVVSKGAVTTTCKEDAVVVKSPCSDTHCSVTALAERTGTVLVVGCFC